VKVGYRKKAHQHKRVKVAVVVCYHDSRTYFGQPLSVTYVDAKNDIENRAHQY
jgi:uncharacterized RmlC-like cupin family protein